MNRDALTKCQFLSGASMRDTCHDMSINTGVPKSALRKVQDAFWDTLIFNFSDCRVKRSFCRELNGLIICVRGASRTQGVI